MLEHTIAQTIETHPDCGVALWGPRRLRDMKGFKSAESKFDDQGNPINGEAIRTLDALAAQFAADIDFEQQRGVKTIVMSEENILGTMTKNFQEKEFYPKVANRLRAYARLLPLTPRKIAMGVREYGAVWSSAYFYSEQRGRKLPPPQELRTVMTEDALGWLRVTRDVHKVWPDAPIQMWQQTDLADNLATICASVMRLDKDLIVLPAGRVNARVAEKAKKQLFADDELGPLSARYKRHLKRINRGDGVEWIGGAI